MPIVTWLLCVLSSIITMDYQPHSVRQLLDAADLVIVGAVENVSTESYTVTVEERLFGPVTDNDTVTVRRHRYWPGTERWTEPSPGQRVLLFLKPEPDGIAWRIQGIGGEGEMPIAGDYLYLQGTHLPGLDRTSHTVHGTALQVQRLPWATVQDAIAAHRCVSAAQTEPEPRDCGDRDDVRGRSLLHATLVD